jgi:ribosomal protein S18 acetylase RimI-like enzyme
MAVLSLSPLRFSSEEIAAVVDLYASNTGYWRSAGEYDPENIPADVVEADLRREVLSDGCEILLGRDERGTLVGLLSLLDRHPVDGHPWIGLLMVHGAFHRRGIGRLMADAVEEKYGEKGRDGIGLAVLENRPSALAFWESLGWREVDRRPDVEHGRPCIVMHKALA